MYFPLTDKNPSEEWLGKFNSYNYQSDGIKDVILTFHR